MKNYRYEYISVYQDIIKELINFNQSLGFKYEVAQKQLKKFDRFIYSKNISEIDLNKQLVNEFASKSPHEAQSSQNIRVSCIRSLAKFLISKGYEAYVYPPLPRGAYTITFIPYIFTNQELQKFFTVADENVEINKKRGKAYSLIFRLLYGTGMRVSEVLSLMLEDIDFDQNLILVKNGKHNRERLIPVHPELMKNFKEYLVESNRFYTSNTFCFSHDQKPFSTDSVYSAFRNYLWKARIPHGGKSKGPRVHDFRHTFCIHRIRNWIREGRDITALFPYLCAYLGHADTRGTEYYFRLTAEFYPEMVSRFEKYWKDGEINEE